MPASFTGSFRVAGVKPVVLQVVWTLPPAWWHTLGVLRIEGQLVSHDWVHVPWQPVAVG